jgi:hypothetical protein
MVFAGSMRRERKKVSLDQLTLEYSGGGNRIRTGE